MLGGLLAALALAACAGGATDLPEEFLGRWYYMGSSGGLDGSGLGDAAVGYIVINPDGTLTHHDEDGTLVAARRFRASVGRTIFSAEDGWFLTFDDTMPEVISVSEDGQTMSLSENVYDGYQRGFRRNRSPGNGG